MTNETTVTAVETVPAVEAVKKIDQKLSKSRVTKGDVKSVLEDPSVKKALANRDAKKAAKKAPAKAAKKTEVKGKKTPAKKATKAAPAAKAEKNGEAGGLRKPQIRILLALLKKPQQTRVQLSASAPVDQAACVEYVGSAKEEVRLANDVKHFPSLISLKLVKQEQVDIDGKDVITYSLTAAGKKEAEKNKGK